MTLNYSYVKVTDNNAVYRGTEVCKKEGDHYTLKTNGHEYIVFETIQSLLLTNFIFYHNTLMGKSIQIVSNSLKEKDNSIGTKEFIIQEYKKFKEKIKGSIVYRVDSFNSKIETYEISDCRFNRTGDYVLMTECGGHVSIPSPFTFNTKEEAIKLAEKIRNDKDEKLKEKEYLIKNRKIAMKKITIDDLKKLGYL